MGAGVCVICDRHLDRGLHLCEAAGGLLCRACYVRDFQPRRPCAGCGRTQPTTRWLGGKSFCCTCYKREILLAVCFYCHEKRRLHARDPRGKPTCISCYDQRFAPREPCLFCKELSVARMRGPEGECICQSCWTAELRPRRPCAMCGNLRVAARLTPEGESICPQCYFEEKPKAKCPYCGEMARLMHREDGDWICRRCYPKFLAPRHPCAICGVVEAVAAWRSEKEPLCRRCYHTNEQPRDACRDCGRVLPISRRDADGRGICNTCYARVHRPAGRTRDGAQAAK